MGNDFAFVTDNAGDDFGVVATAREHVEDRHAWFDAKEFEDCCRLARCVPGAIGLGTCRAGHSCRVK